MNWPDWHVVSTDDTDAHRADVVLERDDVYATVSLWGNGVSPAELHDLVATHLSSVEKCVCFRATVPRAALDSEEP